jgi:LPPG:FO 2-phospho-L-lactate transferase
MGRDTTRTPAGTRGGSRCRRLHVTAKAATSRSTRAPRAPSAPWQNIPMPLRIPSSGVASTATVSRSSPFRSASGTRGALHTGATASGRRRPVSLQAMITALAGGVGAARLLRGLVRVVPPSEVTAIVNTGDDTVLHGLLICPDLDTVTYTLAGMNDDERGWGQAGETWTVMGALERLGGEAWFRLGDLDLATHLFRTQRLADGAPLSVVTAEITAAVGVGARLLPMTDGIVRTRVTVAEGTEIAFQEYFVRRQHSVAVTAVRFEGVESCVPAPGVLEALSDADVVVICPSNPVVSIGPLLAVPGIADSLRRRRHRVVAVSPIVAGAALRGPADRLMTELGHQSSVVGVARLYAEVAGTLVVDHADQDLASAVEALGVRCVVAPTVMRTADDARRLSATVLDAVTPVG